MKAVIAAAAALLAAAPVVAAESTQTPGVADKETTIPSGGITQFALGKGDTIFVRDVRGRWYRLGLNQGCLNNIRSIDGLVFDTGQVSSQINRMTNVAVYGTDGFRRTCAIRSIRRSVAPPQYDSKSPIEVD